MAEVIKEYLVQPEMGKSREITEKDITQYRQDVQNENENYPMWHDVIGPHTQRVESFAKELSISEGLTKEERNKVITAVIFHDSIKAKPGINVLDHGEESAKFAEIKFIERQRDEKTAEEITNAIRRHMVYPFLVKLAEKLGHADFPQPETELDKILYDADVLDNISIKNIAFRLDPEKDQNYIADDRQVAQEKNISQLEAAMENIISSVEEAVGSLSTESGKRMGREKFAKLRKAVKELNYSEIQVGENGNVDAKKTMEKLNNAMNKLLGIKEQ